MGAQAQVDHDAQAAHHYTQAKEGGPIPATQLGRLGRERFRAAGYRSQLIVEHGWRKGGRDDRIFEL